jgi:hypothetical protein
VRFLYTGIGFHLTLLGLTATTLTAVAAPMPPTTSSIGSQTALAVMSETKQDLTVITGNGVEFHLPAGFTGGSPSSSQTRAMIAATAKEIPSMAPFVKVLDNDPSMLRAIAMSTDSSQNPSMVLVTRLPIPAQVSLENLQQMMAKFMPSMLPPEFKLVNNQIVNVGSRQIVQMGIDVNVSGLKLQESIGLFKEGDDIYQVTYVYTTNNTHKATAVFHQIFNTFKATPIVPVRTPVI